MRESPTSAGPDYVKSVQLAKAGPRPITDPRKHGKKQT
jgi:hypothetical protein